MQIDDVQTVDDLLEFYKQILGTGPLYEAIERVAKRHSQPQTTQWIKYDGVKMPVEKDTLVVVKYRDKSVVAGDAKSRA